MLASWSMVPPERMAPKPTTPQTPRITTNVPIRSSLVISVPRSHLAKRKLKTREVLPSGATYSARMYCSARVEPRTCETM